MSSAPVDEQSDKYFWHRYTDAYEVAFERLGDVHEILEFGVFHGASLRWLAQRFPDARIVGVDILPVQPEWPVDARIGYQTVDQGRPSEVAAMFRRLHRTFDLLIEDGSHVPEHQVTCVIQGLQRVRSGGLYVLEDVHTSHPAHPLMAGRTVPAAFAVLLGLAHLREVGAPLDRSTAELLAAPGFFTSAQVRALAAAVSEIRLVRRDRLPLRCYACGAQEYDYARLRCRCGTGILDEADSMSFLLTRA